MIHITLDGLAEGRKSGRMRDSVVEMRGKMKEDS